MSLIGKDPVCGMLADAHKIEIAYAWVRYAFCSEQCHE